MKKWIFIAAVLLAAPAFALDLSSARSNGDIGEGTDGYVHAIHNSPEINAFVSDVNAKRKAEYARISAQNGQPTDVVAKLAVPAIVEKLPAGAKYQDASGNWKSR